MTFITAMIISAFILSAVALATVLSKKGYNRYRRSVLREREGKLASKLEKFKSKNQKYYKICTKLAQVRMKLSKYHVSALSEIYDVEGMTKKERKLYYKYNYANHRLQLYQTQVKAKIINQNKLKENVLNNKIAKFEKKLSLSHSSKILPGTFLDIGDGVLDTRTRINLGLEYKSSEQEFMSNMSEKIRGTRSVKAKENFTHIMQIESSDQTINGMEISSNYKQIFKEGEAEVLKLVGKGATKESFPITIVDISKPRFGKSIHNGSHSYKNEKELKSYIDSIVKTTDKSAEKVQ